MFQNPGSKLKTLAIVVFVITVVIFCVAGIIAGRAADSMVLIILIIALGILVGWLSSIILYAFGSLVQDVEDIKSAIDLGFQPQTDSREYSIPRAPAPSAQTTTQTPAQTSTQMPGKPTWMK